MTTKQWLSEQLLDFMTVIQNCYKSTTYSEDRVKNVKNKQQHQTIDERTLPQAKEIIKTEMKKGGQ